ncbi:hypothetical protein DR864_15600 [Runella rosea]|uniref:Uncharacterized protein n=1 Tax=Runella rosea TaxID=2259595 RepID=A0A344TKA2_9BACT|nr:hypothetical protein DR864_15600 [Runella rosea]
MEIALLITITGFVGLATSVGMLYLSHSPTTPSASSANRFSQQKRDDFFRKVKLNSHRIK